MNAEKIKLLKISKHQKPQQPQQPQQPYQSIPVNAYKAPYVEVAVNLAPVEVISTIQPAKNQEVDEQPNDSKPSNDHVEPIYPSLNVWVWFAFEFDGDTFCQREHFYEITKKRLGEKN